MTPILQGLSTLAIGIFLCRTFLCEVSLIVCYHLAHVRDIFLIILAGVFLGVLLQDLDDFPTATRISDLMELVVLGRLIVQMYSPLMPNGLTRAIVLGPACAGRIFSTEPFLQLIWTHIDELIELSELGSAFSSQKARLMLLVERRCTHLMTVSLSLT